MDTLPYSLFKQRGLSHGLCGGVCFLYFAFAPPSLFSLTCSFSVCVCGCGSWVAHLRGIASSLTACFYLVSPPVRPRTIASNTATWWCCCLVFFFFFVFFAFVPMPFLFIAFHRGLQCHSTLLCLCSPESLHAGSLRPSFPACLPTWHPPSSTSLYNKSSLHYLLSPLSAFGSKNTISTMTVFTLFLLKKINK